MNDPPICALCENYPCTCEKQRYRVLTDAELVERLEEQNEKLRHQVSSLMLALHHIYGVASKSLGYDFLSDRDPPQDVVVEREPDHKM